MVSLDLNRWRALCRAAADAADDGPTTLQLQDASDRRARIRDELTRFRARGPQGQATGRPTARAHADVQLHPGVGGHDQAAIEKAFNADLRELEGRVAEADGEVTRIGDRLRECSERRFRLQRLIEQVRGWAAGQSPPVRLPDVIERRGVTLQGPPPGAHDFFGRPAP